MSIQDTPSALRVHIGLFGRRNVGKSSLMNALLGQELSIVSKVKGTTTDPVKKTMEFLPIGPVVCIDTPGLDDEGQLGNLRVQKSYQVLDKTDIALLVLDIRHEMEDTEKRWLKVLQDRKIPYLLVYNKCELIDRQEWAKYQGENQIAVSADKGYGIEKLKEMIAEKKPASTTEYPILADLIQEGDKVVLVMPIDASAPKGRLILPQQQTLREILDCRGVGICCQTGELAQTLKVLGDEVRLVVTDSQAFKQVEKIVPRTVLLTSFSILFARYKGLLASAVAGAAVIDKLEDGDRVLISEGCTHHRQCEDIGTKKLPAWIQQYTGKKLLFSFTSGTEFPEDVTQYKLVVHCGGCMLNPAEVKSRVKHCEQQHVPITNYGICISYLNGILDRCIEML